MSTHEDYYWTAGDDWQINATLLDYTGAPFDLSGTTQVCWSLKSEAGDTVLTEDDVNIIVVDPTAGQCAIQVPGEMSSPLIEGRYTDMIRIVYAGTTSTLSHGLNWVTADPWFIAP
jgi:hypothetical protein